jgi:hypothetical protein
MITEEQVRVVADALRATIRISWDENLEIGRITERNIAASARAALEAAFSGDRKFEIVPKKVMIALRRDAGYGRRRRISRRSSDTEKATTKGD